MVLRRVHMARCWTQIERLTVKVSGGSLWAEALLFKSYAALASILIVLLTASISRRLDLSQGSWAVVAVGANPLLLIEGPGMGHNDLVAIAGVLCGIWLQLRFVKRRSLDLTIVFLTSLVKVHVVPAIFVFVHWLIRSQKSYLETVGNVARSLAPTIVMLSIAGWPFVSHVSDVPLLFGLANANQNYEIRFTPVNFLKDSLVRTFTSAGLDVSPESVKFAILTASLFVGSGYMSVATKA